MASKLLLRVFGRLTTRPTAPMAASVPTLLVCLGRATAPAIGRPACAMSTLLASARAYSTQESARQASPPPNDSDASSAPQSDVLPPWGTSPPPMAPPSAPYFVQLKAGLKTAMRAKDVTRLTVLRLVTSEVQKMSKTTQPITTNGQLVALMARMARACRLAAEDFRSANRADLAQKEEAQIAVLDGYIADSGVPVLGEAELRALGESLVEAAMAQGKTKKKEVLPTVIKQLLGEGGEIERSAFEPKLAAGIVKEIVDVRFLPPARKE